MIDYKRRSFLEAGEVYDAVFDTIGKESLERCAPVLARDGVYVTFRTCGKLILKVR